MQTILLKYLTKELCPCKVAVRKAHVEQLLKLYQQSERLPYNFINVYLLERSLQNPDSDVDIREKFLVS